MGWRRSLVELIERDCVGTKVKCWVVYDADGDPEVLLHQPGVRGFGRICLGNEDTGARYAFWSYGWQGFGGLQLVCEAEEAEVRRVAAAIRDLLKSEGRAYGATT